MDKNVIMWATAISTHAENGRKILWRFAQVLQPTFDVRLLPDRIILEWRYESDNGQPNSDEYQRMSNLEDLVESATEKGDFATLALVSTGEGLREWSYYAKDGDEFVERLNLALHGELVFPIEIHVENDPTWSMYRRFVSGVKNKAN